MKPLTEGPYDLLPVIIAKEKLYTRPIDFTMDDLGATHATKYNSTCPKCSQLIEFTPSDVYQLGKDYYVSGCKDCPVPAGCTKACGEACAVKQPDVTPLITPPSVEFVDPIESKVMSLDGVVAVNV